MLVRTPVLTIYTIRREAVVSVLTVELSKMDVCNEKIEIRTLSSQFC